MNILLIPFLIILTPLIILFFTLRYLNKTSQISVLMKIALGIIFIATGIIATYFAMLTSMYGMSEKGVKCVTGAVFFIPLGFLVNVIGIPVFLILFKMRQRIF